jgi:predicted Zn-dependent protease
MSYHKIRIGLFFLFIGLGIILNIQIGISPAWYLYVTAGILLLTHFLFGTVWSAFSKMRKGNMIEAETLLNQIRKPEWLAKRPKAYYHFIRGVIALQKKDLDEGAKFLKKAIALGLRNNTDAALANLNLAHIAFTQKRPTEAMKYLQDAKACNANDLMIKENLLKLEKAIKTT